MHPSPVQKLVICVLSILALTSFAKSHPRHEQWYLGVSDEQENVVYQTAKKTGSGGIGGFKVITARCPTVNNPSFILIAKSPEGHYVRSTAVFEGKIVSEMRIDFKDVNNSYMTDADGDKEKQIKSAEQLMPRICNAGNSQDEYKKYLIEGRRALVWSGGSVAEADILPDCITKTRGR